MGNTALFYSLAGKLLALRSGGAFIMKVKVIDTGLLASAVQTVKRNSSKLALYALALVACIALSAVQVHAQAAGGGTANGGYALGADGGPVASDYLNSGIGFANNLGPILKASIGLLLGMLAVWQGPRIIKSLVLRFSH